MEIVRTIPALGEYLEHREGSRGFVPTMGALHQGHISLVEIARRENDTVIVSIFVNPTQFNDPRDLERYPRTEKADLQLLAAAGTDVVFAPSVKEIYPEPDRRRFDFGPLEKVMEAAHRPGHFNGVAQVVSRLFDIVRPDRAYFGEKDFQQIAVIEALVEKLGMDVDIVRCPIVRAQDGLALSSRNILLTPAQREAAPEIYRALKEVAARIRAGRDVEEAKRWARAEIDRNPFLETEYLEVADPHTLSDIAEPAGKNRIFAAIKCGDVRLIDNIGVEEEVL